MEEGSEQQTETAAPRPTDQEATGESGDWNILNPTQIKAEPRKAGYDKYVNSMTSVQEGGEAVDAAQYQQQQQQQHEGNGHQPMEEYNGSQEQQQ